VFDGTATLVLHIAKVVWISPCMEN
jgi:hypothetical protein